MHKDLGDHAVKLWVLLAAHTDEALGASEEGLLVALRGGQLRQLANIHIIRAGICIAYLFQQTSPLGDLGNNVVIEQGLSKYK